MSVVLFRRIKNVFEARRRMGPDDELFENTPPFPLRSVRKRHHRIAQCLNMEIGRRVSLDVGQPEFFIAKRVVTAMRTVVPLRVAVADTHHVKIETRREIDLRLRSLAILKEDRAGLRMARAGMVSDLVADTVHFLRLRIRTERAYHARQVPRLAVLVIIHMEERNAVVEIERRPEPEELKFHRRHMRL